MEGRAPQKDGEIALDRLFAENRELKIGDSVVLGGEKLEIVGTVALSDSQRAVSEQFGYDV